MATVTWKVLDLPKEATAASGRLPLLLVSYTFSTGSYTIRLTDLTHLWAETLERRAIIARSFEQNTSIDPSEDAAQLRIFLAKIRSALDGSSDTTVAVSLQSGARGKSKLQDHAPKAMLVPPGLLLHVTIELPTGLKALEWPVHLELVAQSSFTETMTLPLLRAQRQAWQESQSLLSALEEKDGLIQKLLDKLEAQGMELSVLFPSAVGKLGRKFDRTKAAERVKGLGRFDVTAWRQALGAEQSELQTDQLVREVFSKEQHLHIDSDASETAMTWWEHLNGEFRGSIIDSGGKASIGNAEPQPAARRETPEQPEADDFQVQGTPSQPPAGRGNVSGVHYATDGEDDDLDASSQEYQDSTKQTSIRSPKRATQTQNDSKKSPTKAPKNKIASSSGAINDSSTTADDSDGAPPPKASKLMTASPANSTSRRKGKLSKIGTRKQASLSAEAASPSPPESTETPTATNIGAASHGNESTATADSDEPETKKRNLGTLGRKKTRSAVAKHEAGNDDVDSSSTAEASRGPEKVANKRKAKLGAVGYGKRKHGQRSSGSESGSPIKSEDQGTAGGNKNKANTSTAARKSKHDTTGVTAADGASMPMRGRANEKPADELTAQTREGQGERETKRETSQERADAKRLALKRELEAQARARVRKKKRF